MADRIRLTWNELVLGGKIPWNVYAEDGKLLMSPGQEITQSILDKITKYVLYRDKNQGAFGGIKVNKQVNAFEKFDELVTRLGGVFEDIVMANGECKEKIENISHDIFIMINNELDASLACVLLPNNYPYSLSHPIQCAILCAIVAGRDYLPAEEQKMIIAAALTSNVGMRAIQENLHEKDITLTEAQEKEVKGHPAKAVDMLKKIDMDNQTLLNIVLRHHERCNGSGYPNGVSAERIPCGALILSIADSFSAMVTERGYRQRLSSKEAMIELFKDQGLLFDNRYELLLIKEVTIFPPGSFVKLKNGEIALVLRRGKMNTMEPEIKSIIGRDGKRYANPLMRDCNQPEYQIEKLLRDPPKIALNTSKLWGYL